MLIENVDGATLAAYGEHAGGYQNRIHLNTENLGENVPHPDFYIRSIKVYEYSGD
jgi:hypothetical protein